MENWIGEHYYDLGPNSPSLTKECCCLKGILDAYQACARSFLEHVFDMQRSYDQSVFPVKRTKWLVKLFIWKIALFYICWGLWDILQQVRLIWFHKCVKIEEILLLSYMKYYPEFCHYLFCLLRYNKITYIRYLILCSSSPTTHYMVL